MSNHPEGPLRTQSHDLFARTFRAIKLREGLSEGKLRSAKTHTHRGEEPAKTGSFNGTRVLMVERLVLGRISCSFAGKPAVFRRCVEQITYIFPCLPGFDAAAGAPV